MASSALAVSGVVGCLPSQLRQFGSELLQMSDEDINSVKADGYIESVTTFFFFFFLLSAVVILDQVSETLWVQLKPFPRGIFSHFFFSSWLKRKLS